MSDRTWSVVLLVLQFVAIPVFMLFVNRALRKRDDAQAARVVEQRKYDDERMEVQRKREEERIEMQRKHDEEVQRKQDEREKNQLHRDRLILDMQNANAGLSFAIVTAIKNGKVNGELTTARDCYGKAYDNYSSFLQDLGIEAMRCVR